VEIPDSIRALFDAGRPAHLTTLDRDGAPFTTLAWVGVEGPHLVIATLFDQRKLRNMRRDPRVSLSVEAGTRNHIGLDEYAVITGRASVTEGGAPTLLARLAEAYLGPDAEFPAIPDPPEGFVTRITVDGIHGVGPWRPE
jgi:PPOX class probable F420-dependent enzyme